MNEARQFKRASEGRPTFTCCCKVCGETFDSTEPGAKYCSTGIGSCLALARTTTGAAERQRMGHWTLLLESMREPNQLDVGSYKRALRKDPCCYCGEPSAVLDHIVPRAESGPDDWTNLTGACEACNQRKGYVPLLLHLGWLQAQHEWEPWRNTIATICTPRGTTSRRAI